MACFMIVLVAMVAFALDIGYICRVKAELQNAADAAALAGAHEAMKAALVNDQDLSAIAANTIDAAQAAARQFSSCNMAGGIGVEVPVTDIIVGYQQSPWTSALTPWESGQPVPNCVQVTTRRDSVVNGPLPLIFGPALGTRFSHLTATAAAAFDVGRYTVVGFKSNGPNAKLLPITISVEAWSEFLSSGLSPDGQRYDSYTVDLTLPNSPTQPPNNVRLASDQTPELIGVYPLTTMPGNFGLVKLNPDVSPATPRFSDWIHDGPSAADLSAFGPSGLAATPSSPLTLEAGPGLRSTLVQDLADIIGQPRALPLYSSYSRTGATGTYTIVGFAGITVVSATDHGTHIKIVIQPSIVIDPTANTGSQRTVTQFVYPRLPVMLVR